MTADVASKVLAQGGTPDEAVATALATTAFATASLGVALVVIGKLKLARFVAYLPMPVVSESAVFVAIFGTNQLPYKQAPGSVWGCVRLCEGGVNASSALGWVVDAVQ